MTKVTEYSPATIELWEVCEEGNLNEVERLIKEGADVTAAANEAVCEAIRNGHVDVVKFLLEIPHVKIFSDSDSGHNGNYSLRYAAGRGHRK